MAKHTMLLDEYLRHAVKHILPDADAMTPYDIIDALLMRLIDAETGEAWEQARADKYAEAIRTAAVRANQITRRL